MPDPWTASALQLPRLPAAPSEDALELHLAALEYALASPLVTRDRDDVRSARHRSHLLEPFEHHVAERALLGLRRFRTLAYVDAATGRALGTVAARWRG